MKVDLKGYQGQVKKAATVFSNDPRNSKVTITVKGKINALVQLSPGGSISFQGPADRLGESSIDMTATSQPFHITKLESNLDGNIAYQLATVEEGKHYRLTVKNQAKEGTYRGFVKAYTDLAQKPEVQIRVAGNIEGEIVIRPQTVLVGKLAPDQPARVGRVLVTNSLNKSFKITNLTYDGNLIDISQQPLPEGKGVGYSLEISPKAETATAGQNQHQELKLVIETDADQPQKHEVKVYLVRR